MNIELTVDKDGTYKAVICYPWGQKVACHGSTAKDAVKLAASNIGRVEMTNLDLSRALAAVEPA